jgi:hypothetical protein
MDLLDLELIHVLRDSPGPSHVGLLLHVSYGGKIDERCTILGVEDHGGLGVLEDDLLRGETDGTFSIHATPRGHHGDGGGDKRDSDHIGTL